MRVNNLKSSFEVLVYEIRKPAMLALHLFPKALRSIPLIWLVLGIEMYQQFLYMLSLYKLVLQRWTVYLLQSTKQTVNK